MKPNVKQELEEVPKTDRYLVEDKTFDKHFDESYTESMLDQMSKQSTMTDEEILDLHV